MGKPTLTESVSVVRFLEKRISKTESDTFYSWLSRHKSHQALLDDIKCVYDYAPSVDYLSEVDPEFAWKKIEQKIAKTNLSSPRKSSTFFSSTWGKVAAAFLLLLVTLNGLLLIINKPSKSQYITHKTHNQISTFLLPDSSKVVLNAHTSLIYPASFSANKREVFLEGQAYFELASHEKPFLVNTNWGTAEGKSNIFEVSAYRDLQQVEVIVESGLVHFHKPEEKQPNIVSLKQGESILYTSQGKQELKPCCNKTNRLAWKVGYLHYLDTDIDVVFKELESLYHVTIRYPKKITTLSGQYRYTHLDSLLQQLQAELAFTYQKSGTTINISWNE